jgi:VIT1/CCC1 family predicted Fe2+/Mn2+ transporter
MAAPSDCDLNSIRDHRALRKGDPTSIVDKIANTWGTKTDPRVPIPDLVALQPRDYEDLFLEWLMNGLTDMIISNGGHQGRLPAYGTDYVVLGEGRPRRIAQFISNILASMVPVLAIVILYNVKSMAARLALIAVFTAIFTICASQFRKIDMFTAVSA